MFAFPRAVPGELFSQDAYLRPLEQNCANAEQGWQKLADDAPATYLKQHSWGEFVFDFEFARAYQQAGLQYYPKLLCAVPFTPVSGPRLLGRSAGDLRTMMAEHEANSAHALFLVPEERENLILDGWHGRCDVRYVWCDQGFGDFEGFLAALSSKRRKTIRRERKKICEADVRINWLCAAELNEADWAWLYRLYADTYHRRGQAPYLDAEVLRAWGQAFPEHMLFCLASTVEQGTVAMAMYFRDETHLYGRHWGAAIDVDALHFELCYYQGIEYCLREGLRHFDAGVQGGHRLLRGFEPVLSHSAHFFADKRFHELIGRYLAREREAVMAQCEELRQQTAFKRL